MALRLCFSLLFISFFGFNSVAQPYKCVQTLNDHPAFPTILITKPSESSPSATDHPVLVQGNKDGSIYFRSVEDGALLKQMNAHREDVNYMDFNSTGAVISTSQNGEIKIYDFAKDQIIHQKYSPDYEGIRFALFSIADGFIYFNAKSRLYKTRSDLTQDVEKIYDLTQPISAGIITSNRAALILALDKYLYVINTRTDEIIQQLYTGNSPVEKLFLMPDSKVLSWSADVTMQIWQMTMGQISGTVLTWFKAGAPGNVSFSNDGLKMLTGNIGNWARLWTPMKKNVDQELYGHSAVVTSFAFSPDDKTIFTASEDQTIKVWKQKDSLQLTVDSLQKQPKPSIPPPPPVVNSKPETVNPIPSDVQMASENVPSQIKGRAVKRTEKIILKKSTVDILIYDNELIDGDTLSLFFNNEWILKNYPVIREKKKITLTLQPKTNNYLVLFAENLGLKPPNTAVVRFSDGKQNRTIRLSSDLTKCSAINFIYRN